MKKDLQVFLLLHRAHASLFRATDQFLKEKYSLTSTQVTVLLVLLKKDKLPISTIGTMLNMSKSGLTGIINRMSKIGLLEKKQSETDARIFNVHLSRKGRMIVINSLPDIKKLNSSFLECFSKDEQMIIDRFLCYVDKNASEIVRKIND